MSKRKGSGDPYHSSPWSLSPGRCPQSHKLWHEVGAVREEPRSFCPRPNGCGETGPERAGQSLCPWQIHLYYNLCGVIGVWGKAKGFMATCCLADNLAAIPWVIFVIP